MNVILEKDGQTIQYGTGSALYLLLNLIPFVGGIVTLVLIIIKKQFRGVSLNQIVLSLIFFVIYFVMAMIIAATESAFLAILLLLFALGFGILGIVMYVYYILNANYYSIKQRLEEGYTVVNGDDEAVKLAVQRAVNIKLPFWQILSF